MGSDVATLPSSGDQSLAHFRAQGWLRVVGAFSGAQAGAMRDVVWEGLARQGVRRDAPESWTIERPVKLQGLKDHADFRAVGSARLLEAIGAVLETRAFETPRRWGAIFVAFPTARAWGVPAGGWHIDANYRSDLAPPRGVQTHALFGDVGPRLWASAHFPTLGAAPSIPSHQGREGGGGSGVLGGGGGAAAVVAVAAVEDAGGVLGFSALTTPAPGRGRSGASMTAFGGS